MTRINFLVTTLFEVFNRLQAFLFFLSFFGESTPIRAQVFLLARGSHHNVEIAEKLGKRVNKSENFNPRTTTTTISSVNTDIGAEFCPVGLEPSTSRKAVQRPTT